LEIEMALENLPVWSFRPNWSDGVLESLEWSTEVMTSPTGAEQRNALRLSPRRFFEITVNPWQTDRQYFEVMLNKFGRSDWYVPVWHDVELLQESIAEGATIIPIDLNYREFMPGASVIFLGQSAREFEIIQIQNITDTGLVLVSPTTKVWRTGDRLYPGVKAFISATTANNLRYMSDRVSQGTFQFQTRQPNPIQGEGFGWGNLWGLVWGGAQEPPWYIQSGWGNAWGFNWSGESNLPYEMFLGYPVLVQRPNVANRLTSGFQMMVQTVDNNTSIPIRIDTAGRGFNQQQYEWLLYRRKAHAEFRGLLHYMKGQLVPLWLPTFYEDFSPVAPINVGNDFFDVRNFGFSLAGGVQAGRQFIIVERHGQRPMFRRLVGSTVLSENVERVFVHGPWVEGADLDQIRRISFMELSRLSQDRIEITHHTDAQGASACAAVFQASPEVRQAIMVA
jgi:hypothetical protein